HEATQPIAQVIRRQVPDRVVGRNLRDRPPGPRRDGRSGGETFEAPSMEWADARKRIAIHNRHRYMAQFWVDEPLNRPTVDENSTPNSSANRQVKERLNSDAGSPA